MERAGDPSGSRRALGVCGLHHAEVGGKVPVLLMAKYVLLALVLSAASVQALFAIGCHGSSGDSGAPCNVDPWQCGSGQTCWPESCVCPSGQACDPTNCTPQFQCVASVAAQQGQSCSLTIGSATCGDQLTCFQLGTSAGSGVCRPFCDPSDPSHGCTSGFQCTTVLVGNSEAQESVCLPVIDQDAAFGVEAGGEDAGFYDPDALPDQPDVLADSGQHHT